MVSTSLQYVPWLERVASSCRNSDSTSTSMKECSLLPKKRKLFFWMHKVDAHVVTVSCVHSMYSRSTVVTQPWTTFWVQIRGSVTGEVTCSHSCGLNAKLAGIPQYLLRRIQSVMDAAAHTNLGLLVIEVIDHITLPFGQLHWLKANKQIDFILAVLVFKSVHGSALPYLADELL